MTRIAIRAAGAVAWLGLIAAPVAATGAPVVRLPPISNKPPPVAQAPAAAPAPVAAPTPQAPSPAAAAAVAQTGTLRVPEGTELRIRFNDALSSGANSEGDQFSITLDDNVELPGGAMLKRGYRGKGEITSVKKKGMMGQPGEMNVRLNYIKVGDTRVHLRGQKGGEGKSSVGTTVVLTVLFGPLGLLKHGHEIEIHPGQVITAYVDEDCKLQAPLEPPPHDE